MVWPLIPIAIVFARAVAQRLIVAGLSRAPTVVPALGAAANTLTRGTPTPIETLFDRVIPLAHYAADIASAMWDSLLERGARARREDFSTLMRMTFSASRGDVHLLELGFGEVKDGDVDRRFPTATIGVGEESYMVSLTGERSQTIVVLRIGHSEAEDEWVRVQDLPPGVQRVVANVGNGIGAFFY